MGAYNQYLYRKSQQLLIQELTKAYIGNHGNAYIRVHRHSTSQCQPGIMSGKNYASKTAFQPRKKVLILVIRYKQTFARLNVFPIDLFQMWYQWMIFHIKIAMFLLKISAKSHKGIKTLKNTVLLMFSKRLASLPPPWAQRIQLEGITSASVEFWPQCETTSSEEVTPAALSFMLASPYSGWW